MARPGETDPNSSSEEIFGSVGVGPLRRAGFNVLTWDARGFGESGGNVEVDSPAFEGRDVEALITYVSQQPEAQLDAPGDPRMGMAGVSYGGGIQLVTAAIDKRVDAITPTIAWNSLLTALYKDATVKEGWGLALSGAGGTAFTGGLPGGETGNQDPQITQAIAEGTSTGKFSDKTVQFFDSRGPRQLLSKVKVPTLLIEGTADTLFTLHESIQNFAALSKNGIPLRMMWFCGGHGVCLGNNGPDGRIESAVIGWLRYYVQRDHKAKLPPKFTYSGTAAPADTRLYAQVLDQNTGRVLGNQVVPIPVTLDGKDHTVERSLEAVATRGGPNARLRVAGGRRHERVRPPACHRRRAAERASRRACPRST